MHKCNGNIKKVHRKLHQGCVTTSYLKFKLTWDRAVIEGFVPGLRCELAKYPSRSHFISFGLIFPTTRHELRTFFSHKSVCLFSADLFESFEGNQTAHFCISALF
jgi:hypothetical protein